MSRILSFFLVAISAVATACFGGEQLRRAVPAQTAAGEPIYTLSNEQMSVSVGADGRLYSLRNLTTDHDYATGQGDYLWRMYYDAPYQKEIQIVGENQPISVCQQGDTITIAYPSLTADGKTLNMALTLRVVLESDKVRFISEIANNEPHTVVRELQYPLVRNVVLPSDHKLFTSEAGGKLYDNPTKLIGSISSAPYKKPEQIFRQHNVKYGYKVFMNCFGLLGEQQGLYFGSHDNTWQDTWHGLRAYKGNDGEFDALEFGFYKYPHCFAGEKWLCEGNVVSPYSGTWPPDPHRTCCADSAAYGEPPSCRSKAGEHILSCGLLFL